MLQSAIPVLRVSQSIPAEEFYCQRLGFQKLFGYRIDETRSDPCYMGLIRDGVVLHVSSSPGDGVSGGVVYVTVDDVDSLHREFIRKNINIALEPTNQSWGNREMYVEDDDGNCLRFVKEGG